MHMRLEDLAPLIREELKNEGVAAEDINSEWLGRLILLEQERLKTVKDFVANTRYFFTEGVELDPKAVDKVLRKRDGAGFQALEGLLKAFGQVEAWVAADLEAAALAYGEAEGLKMGDLAQPLRVAVTGGTVSRGIWETVELLGRERTLARISQALAAK
jgi:glutamyl/glutaminyl-tRNA synthetase